MFIFNLFSYFGLAYELFAEASSRSRPDRHIFDAYCAIHLRERTDRGGVDPRHHIPRELDRNGPCVSLLRLGFLKWTRRSTFEVEALRE